MSVVLYQSSITGVKRRYNRQEKEKEKKEYYKLTVIVYSARRLSLSSGVSSSTLPMLIFVAEKYIEPITVSLCIASVCIHKDRKNKESASRMRVYITEKKK
jgi:hypothetical protein